MFPEAGGNQECSSINLSSPTAPVEAQLEGCWCGTSWDKLSLEEAAGLYRDQCPPPGWMEQP